MSVSPICFVYNDNPICNNCQIWDIKGRMGLDGFFVLNQIGDRPKFKTIQNKLQEKERRGL